MAKSKQSRDIERIMERSRAYDSVKQTSHYPFGRRKGAGLTASPAFQEGWDRIFKGGGGGNAEDKNKPE